VKGDVAMIDRILADDFSYTNADGRIMTKTQHLEDIKSQAYKVESINLENLKVRVFGDAAVVTVGQMEKSQWKGKDSSGQYLFTDIYAKRNGKWQIVAGHGCKIAPQKPKASHFQVDDYLTDHRSPKEW
jgi:ketosteroid isomerase-like protein